MIRKSASLQKKQVHLDRQRWNLREKESAVGKSGSHPFALNKVFFYLHSDLQSLYPVFFCATLPAFFHAISSEVSHKEIHILSDTYLQQLEKS